MRLSATTVSHKSQHCLPFISLAAYLPYHTLFLPDYTPSLPYHRLFTHTAFFLPIPLAYFHITVPSPKQPHSLPIPLRILQYRSLHPTQPHFLPTPDRLYLSPRKSSHSLTIIHYWLLFPFYYEVLAKEHKRTRSYNVSMCPAGISRPCSST